MELLSIFVSILGSVGIYGIIKLLKQFYKNNTFRSSCMIEHEAENPVRNPEDETESGIGVNANC